MAQGSGGPPCLVLCPHKYIMRTRIKKECTSMAKIVTFGEIMLRLAPQGYQRFQQAHCFDAVYGGAEANVAVSLANYGMDAHYVTAVPANPIGDAAMNALRTFGVDVSD